MLDWIDGIMEESNNMTGIVFVLFEWKTKNEAIFREAT